LDSSSLYLKPHNPKHETCLCYLTMLSVTEVIQNMWNLVSLRIVTVINLGSLFGVLLVIQKHSVSGDGMAWLVQ